ncbi:MAG: DUF4065 domain-containing protein [Treponema sp.]|jgi:uncharacterized phage-associated protein|nr:DUF4065 domain-containing protein [Treponema sp.]
MKIQKMLYFLYRDYLKETGISLFSERFSAWKYGPVLESVYHTFKRYGGNSITNYGGTPIYCLKEDDDSTLRIFMDNVWNDSKPYTGIYLSELTHRPESAWYKAWIGNSPFLLDDDILKDTVEIKRQVS